MGRPSPRRWFPMLALIAGAWLAAGSASAATAGPGLTVSTIYPPPGTRLTVSGVRYRAEQTVHILLGTSALGSATTSTTGTFTATVTIPTGAPPGNQTLYANQSPSGLTAHRVIDVRTNWAQEGFGPSHWNDNYHENVLNTGNVGQLTQVWASAGLSGDPLPGESIDDNGELIGDCVSGLCADSPHTGRQIWKLSSRNGGAPLPPLATGGGLVVGSTGYCYTSTGPCQGLLAVNAATGKVVWSKKVPASNEDAPLVIGSTVYYASDTDVEARSLATGKLLWSLADSCNGPPSYANGTLYLGVAGGLQAVSTVTHKQRWFRRTSFAFDDPPVVANGVVYGGYQWSLSGPGYGALEASTGAVVWQNLTLQPTGGSAYGHNGLIYVDTQNGVAALSTATGAVEWTAFPGKFTYNLPPTVANGVLYASVNNGTTGVVAANATTGTTLWSNTLGGVAPEGSPIVVNGWVYVTDENQSTHAFDQ